MYFDVPKSQRSTTAHVAKQDVKRHVKEGSTLTASLVHTRPLTVARLMASANMQIRVGGASAVLSKFSMRYHSRHRNGFER